MHIKNQLKKIIFLIILSCIAFSNLHIEAKETQIPNFFNNTSKYKSVNPKDFIVTYKDIYGGKWHNYFFYVKNNYQIKCDLGNYTVDKHPPNCSGNIPNQNYSDHRKTSQTFGTDTYNKAYLNQTPPTNIYIPPQVRHKVHFLPIGYKIHIPYNQNATTDTNITNTDTTCIAEDLNTFGCISHNLANKTQHGFLIDSVGIHLF